MMVRISFKLSWKLFAEMVNDCFREYQSAWKRDGVEWHRRLCCLVVAFSFSFMDWIGRSFLFVLSLANIFMTLPIRYDLTLVRALIWMRGWCSNNSLFFSSIYVGSTLNTRFAATY